ncbi:MAG: hypothetical protein B7Y95_24460 [Rhizobiales bacterium 32-66-11]|nr:MAG: hypothetical protein B7Y95_24460 [Rhizobiales bacterium 32-66-11]
MLGLSGGVLFCGTGHRPQCGKGHPPPSCGRGHPPPQPSPARGEGARCSQPSAASRNPTSKPSPLAGEGWEGGSVSRRREGVSVAGRNLSPH